MKYAISADFMRIKYATTADFMRIIEKQLIFIFTLRHFAQAVFRNPSHYYSSIFPLLDNPPTTTI